MEIELWWLLAVPLFFGLGWVAARVDIRHLVSQSRALPSSYFRGLGFLLNEEPDKAIDAFIEVVKVDPETIELHFALGNLFRRRGELDRAIRMHSSLVNRPDLAETDRLHAFFELGQDYLKIGLLDRAEEVLSRLGGTAYAARARTFLLEIYQLEKDWERAILAAREIETEGGGSQQTGISHFHCELAARRLGESRPEEARANALAALDANRMAVRATMILGDIEAQAGRHEVAIETWRRIESQDPQYLSLVGQRLIDSYRALSRVREGLTLLAGYLTQYPSVDLLDLVFDLSVELDGAQAAYRVVRDELRRSQTMLGLDKLLDAQLMLSPPDRAADLQVVKDLVHAHTRRLTRYTCENCGFKARQYFWRCPGCNGWETYPPRRVEEIGPLQ
jgi:lipopolysaccharide biosynthesis regulator YciM